MREMDHRNRGQSREVGVAQLRSSVARRRATLFHYQGSGFDVVMRFQLREPRERYFVCFGFLGEVASAAVLDLLYDQSIEFARDHEQTEIFAAQANTVDYPPMQEVYNLGLSDPRLQIAIVADLSDCRVLQIRLSTAP